MRRAAAFALAAATAAAADAPLLSESFDTPGSTTLFSVEGDALDRALEDGALRVTLAAFPEAPAESVQRSPSIDVRPHRGRALRFAVRARTAGMDPAGGGVTAWVRVEDESRRPIVVRQWHVEHGRFFAGTDWATLELVVPVPDDAAHAWLALDMMPGTMWLDDVVVERTALPTERISTDARRYLDAALTTLQDRFVDSKDVDWARLRTLAFAQAGGAQVPRDTYAAIGLVASRLPGGHTMFLSPAMARRAQRGAENASSVAIHPMGEATHVVVPSFVGSGDDDAQLRFAQRSLAALAARGPATKGWIVDLRDNRGGNMWPMLAAIEPLLGTLRPGAFVADDGTNVPWVVAERVRVAAPPDVAVPAETPIAVLVGERTGSSGEAVAIALRGRPRTRFFGAPTAGLATSNESFPLADGAVLVVTTTRMADRTGHVYADRVEPDETCDGDACVEAALAWLRVVR